MSSAGKKKKTRFVPFDWGAQTVDGAVGSGGEKVEDDAGDESADAAANGPTASPYGTANGSPASVPSSFAETSYSAALKGSPQLPPHIERILDHVLDHEIPPLEQIDSATTSPPNEAPTDNNADDVGNQAQTQPLRGMTMNQYGAQPSSRQTPRLQNTQKTGLGNGNAGTNWAFGTPASGNAFGGLAGGAPGLTQGRPQLTGFANAIGGGSGQAPIDLR